MATRRRVCYRFGPGFTVIVVAFVYIFYSAQRKPTYEVQIYTPDKNCPANFSDTLWGNMKRALGVLTDSYTEQHLMNMGFKYGTTADGELLIPNLPNVNEHVPDVPVIVAAASSNHFFELKSLLYNIDTKIRLIYPDIKVVIYDIGFTESEKAQIKNNERCHLRKFDFTKYPDHIEKHLHLCAWKPIIIQEVLNEFGYCIYMDTSIRVLNITSFEESVKVTRLTGHLFISPTQLNNEPYFIPNHTFPGTFQYFHEQPCVFHNIYEVGGGFIFMVKNNLNSYVIMRAWLACCLQRECVMPRAVEKRILECVISDRRYHKCHREDQSVLSIAVSYLYHPTNMLPVIPGRSFEIRGGSMMEYLKSFIPG